MKFGSIFALPALFTFLCILLCNQPTHANSKPILGQINFVFNYDNLFSFGLVDLNKTSANNLTNGIQSYFTNKMWPTLKKGANAAIGGSIKRLFLAAAGLALVIAGGQLIKNTLTEPANTQDKPKKKISIRTHNSRRVLLYTVGTSMVIIGIGSILLCDTIA